MRLDRSKFVAWLAAKMPNEIVGERRNSCGCPIARFYYDLSGGCEVVISENGNGYMIDRGYGDRLLPPWAAKFALAVDHGEGQFVSARRALEIVNAHPPQ